MNQQTTLIWAAGGYECSSKGDSRFSALYAKMPDGRTIEMWYQCDVKGYDIGGTNWKLGKGKPPLIGFSREQQLEMYISIWRLWALHNIETIQELATKARELNNGNLSDCFAGKNPINQANALVIILNEWGI